MNPEQDRTSGTEGEVAGGDIGLRIGRAVLTEGGHDRGLDRSTVHDYEMIDNPEYGASLVSAFLEAVYPPTIFLALKNSTVPYSMHQIFVFFTDLALTEKFKLMTFCHMHAYMSTRFMNVLQNLMLSEPYMCP